MCVFFSTLYVNKVSLLCVFIPCRCVFILQFCTRQSYDVKLETYMKIRGKGESNFACQNQTYRLGQNTEQIRHGPVQTYHPHLWCFLENLTQPNQPTGPMGLGLTRISNSDTALTNQQSLRSECLWSSFLKSENWWLTSSQYMLCIIYLNTNFYLHQTQ